MVFYPLSVVLVAMFVSGSFTSLSRLFCFGLISVNLYTPLKLLLIHALYCFRTFVSSCFCMPLWPSVAFFSLCDLGFLVLFLASIVRVFLRIPVWMNLCQKKLWFSSFCMRFPLV